MAISYYLKLETMYCHTSIPICFHLSTLLMIGFKELINNLSFHYYSSCHNSGILTKRYPNYLKDIILRLNKNSYKLPISALLSLLSMINHRQRTSRNVAYSLPTIRNKKIHHFFQFKYNKIIDFEKSFHMNVDWYKFMDISWSSEDLRRPTHEVRSRYSTLYIKKITC